VAADDPARHWVGMRCTACSRRCSVGQGAKSSWDATQFLMETSVILLKSF